MGEWKGGLRPREEGVCPQGWAAGGRAYVLALPLTDRSTYQIRNFI